MKTMVFTAISLQVSPVSLLFINTITLRRCSEFSNALHFCIFTWFHTHTVWRLDEVGEKNLWQKLYILHLVGDWILREEFGVNGPVAVVVFDDHLKANGAS